MELPRCQIPAAGGGTATPPALPATSMCPWWDALLLVGPSGSGKPRHISARSRFWCEANLTAPMVALVCVAEPGSGVPHGLLTAEPHARHRTYQDRALHSGRKHRPTHPDPATPARVPPPPRNYSHPVAPGCWEGRKSDCIGHGEEELSRKPKGWVEASVAMGSVRHGRACLQPAR